MMNKDKLSVTVSVLERKYKLSIESNDEEFLRKAAKQTLHCPQGVKKSIRTRNFLFNFPG